MSHGGSKKILNILLAECGLELVPKQYKDHPCVKNYTKRTGIPVSRMLLDISYHYPLLIKMDDWKKRGRPDIVHTTLLIAMDSILNKRGYLRIWVHTYDDKIIYIKPEERIPRNYERFKGVFGKLLLEGYVPSPKRWLMRVEEKSVGNFIKEEGFERVILLSEKGKRWSVRKVAEEGINGALIIVGGFQSGDFKESTYKVATEVVSIYPEPLMTWIVVSEIIFEAERLLGLIE